MADYMATKGAGHKAFVKKAIFRSPLDWFFIQNSLAQTDVMLLEKFLSLYQQLNAFKTDIKRDEPKIHRVNRFKSGYKTNNFEALSSDKVVRGEAKVCG